MINNFFTTFSQDFNTIKDYLSHVNNAQLDDKVKLAALRMFAILGMVAVVASGIDAVVVAMSMTKRIFMLAFAAGLYCVSHDIFVIARNVQLPFTNIMATVGSNFINDVFDHVSGKKQITSVNSLRHPHGKGTFFQSLIWDKILWKISISSMQNTI